MQELIKILEQIINEPLRRKGLIRDFQNKIWNQELSTSNEVSDTLKELALDMDYYEPSANLERKALLIMEMKD